MAENRKKPVSGELYRHFRGGIYQIRLLAKDSSDGQEVVVYQAMDPPYPCLVRKLQDFFTPIDVEKYPEAVQNIRFQKIHVEELVRVKSFQNQRLSENHAKQEPDTRSNLQADTQLTDEELEKVLCYGDAAKLVGNRITEEELGRRGFMLFLDADSFHKKRQIFTGLRSYLNQIQINNIAVTLDLVLEEKETEDQCDAILKCLGALEHYEGGRLR